MSSCPLCSPFSDWPASHVVGSLPASTVLLSQDQYFRGWCLVVAKHHVVDLFELSATDRQQLEEDVALVARGIRSLLQPDLMNYAVFGNVIPHLHWNVIPRRMDDGLWGLPPWPHSPVSLNRPEVAELAEQLRRLVGAGTT